MLTLRYLRFFEFRPVPELASRVAKPPQSLVKTLNVDREVRFLNGRENSCLSKFALSLDHFSHRLKNKCVFLSLTKSILSPPLSIIKTDQNAIECGKATSALPSTIVVATSSMLCKPSALIKSLFLPIGGSLFSRNRTIDFLRLSISASDSVGPAKMPGLLLPARRSGSVLGVKEEELLS